MADVATLNPAGPASASRIHVGCRPLASDGASYPPAVEVGRHVPQGLSRVQIGVVACAVVAGALALVYVPQAIDRYDEGADTNAAANYDDREFAGGNAVVVDHAALYEARGLIPQDETYRVVTGSNLRDASALTLEFIESFARSFLLPRRPSDEARWILCYGCDPARLGGRLDVLWRNGKGILIGRLAG